MELADAKLIWSRSVEKRKLCYTTFIGGGDSKSFQQVCDLNLYNNTTPFRTEECLARFSKRLKKTLCTVEKNTKGHFYIQHQLTDPKAYISSNYSTAIL